MSCAHISKSKRLFNVKPTTYHFHMKTDMLADFQICVSVPFNVFIIKSLVLTFYQNNISTKMAYIRDLTTALINISIFLKC